MSSSGSVVSLCAVSSAQQGFLFSHKHSATGRPRRIEAAHCFGSAAPPSSRLSADKPAVREETGIDRSDVYHQRLVWRPIRISLSVCRVSFSSAVLRVWKYRLTEGQSSAWERTLFNWRENEMEEDLDHRVKLLQEIVSEDLNLLTNWRKDKQEKEKIVQLQIHTNQDRKILFNTVICRKWDFMLYWILCDLSKKKNYLFCPHWK